MQIKDSLLEKQVAAIDRYLSFNDRQYRQTRLLGRPVRDRRHEDELPRYKKPLQHKPLREILHPSE